MSIVVTFALAAIGTFLLRSAMVLGGARIVASPAFESRLALVAPSVLAAIVASALFVSAEGASLPNPVLCASVAAAALAVFRTGNVSWALAAGLPVYWVGALAGLV